MAIIIFPRVHRVLATMINCDPHKYTSSWSSWGISSHYASGESSMLLVQGPSFLLHSTCLALAFAKYKRRIRCHISGSCYNGDQHGERGTMRIPPLRYESSPRTRCMGMHVFSTRMCSNFTTPRVGREMRVGWFFTLSSFLSILLHLKRWSSTSQFLLISIFLTCNYSALALTRTFIYLPRSNHCILSYVL
jgi:hypothetical protein